LYTSGPYPEAKFSTLTSRAKENGINPANLFFRTSAASRATPRFLAESRILPPLILNSVLYALEALRGSYFNGATRLEIVFADEEGDPYAVELAGRIGAYVMGQDSDYVILDAPGYLGYIPFEEMQWSIPQGAGIASTAESNNDADAGFRPVLKKKNKSNAAVATTLGRGLLPPASDGGALMLSAVTYIPSTLATHLKIPPNLLPLFASLVGNDFSQTLGSTGGRPVQSLFFESRMTGVARIERVAAAIYAVLHPPTNKRHTAVGNVLEFITKVVQSLLIKPMSLMGSGEVDAAVDSIVQTTVHYAKVKGDTTTGVPIMSTPSYNESVCAIHDSASCSLVQTFSLKIPDQDAFSDPHSQSGNSLPARLLQHEELRSIFMNAYRHGALSARIVDLMYTGTMWPRVLLENPDMETTTVSIGRPIREWAYACLDDSLGVLGMTEAEDIPQEEKPEGTASDDDEIIDVVEDSDSEEENIDDSGGLDLLAPLVGQLQQVKMAGSTSTPVQSLDSVEEDNLDVAPQPPLDIFITEYVRRGGRLAEELVQVQPLSKLLDSTGLYAHGLPYALRPQDERLTLLCHALHSNIPEVFSLPPQDLIPVLVLRFVVHTLNQRALAGNSKEKEKERWTIYEGQSFIASFIPSSPATTDDADSTVMSSANHPIITNRHVQLTAQACSALECVLQLTQVLLLSDQVPSPIHRFSGCRFHAWLSRDAGMGNLSDVVSESTWKTCQTGLQFAVEPGRRKNKSGPGHMTHNDSQRPKVSTKTSLSRGMFDVLIEASDVI
jgi:hypothetical protein